MGKISIIIPTYEPGEYLKECIESVKNQSLHYSNFDVLLILNGNKEPYYSRLEKIIKEMKNIKLYYCEQKGVSNARNLGIDNSKNEYLLFLDDDDILSFNYLEKILKKTSIRNNGNIIISNMIPFKEIKKREIKDDYISSFFKKIKITETRNQYEVRKFLSNACGKLIPRKIVLETRFNSKLENGEDSLFMAEISSRIKSLKITTEDVIYYRRLRENSASRKKKSRKKIMVNNLILIKEYFKLLLKKNYQKKFILSRIVAVFIKIIKV